MTIIGYFEGTDPLLLTRALAAGAETLPLGNSVDGHGKYSGHLTRADGVSVIVGYLHKVMPTTGIALTTGDILMPAKVHGIPTLILAPEDQREYAKRLLGNAVGYVTLVDPADAFDELKKYL
jgi:hypothetical protein